MPLVKTIANKIYCWKNEESLDELLYLLRNNETHSQNINTFNSEERKKQYLTSRVLIKEIIGDYELFKGKNNKPYIELGNTEISLSHNKEYTILMVNKTPCGVDIQAPLSKVLDVKQKFINSGDFCFQSNSIETLSKVWSCKEAAFKQFGTHEIYLKSHITVVELIDNNIFRTIVSIDNAQHQIYLKQVDIENNYLLYTL